MKRAQYRDAPPQNIYSHIDHKWGYDGSGLRVEQSFRREFATIIPSLGVPICSCRHHCDSAGAFCFQRVAPAGDVACQEHRGQRCHQRCTFALVRVRVVVVDDVVQRVVEQFGRRHAQGDGRGRDGVEVPCGVEVHSGRYGGLGSRRSPRTGSAVRVLPWPGAVARSMRRPHAGVLPARWPVFLPWCCRSCPFLSFACPWGFVRTMLWAARLVVQYDRLPGSVWSNWAGKNMGNESAPHRVGTWCGADRQPWAGFRAIQVTRVPGFALH